MLITYSQIHLGSLGYLDSTGKLVGAVHCVFYVSSLDLLEVFRMLQCRFAVEPQKSFVDYKTSPDIPLA